MNLIIGNIERIDCDKAVKNVSKGTVMAYKNNECILHCCEVTDFSAFTLEGGEWSLPDPTETEKLRGDVDYCLMMLGEEGS